MLGDTIKWTTSKWEIGVCMREKKEKCVLHYNRNVGEEGWIDLGEASVGVRGQCYCGSYRKWGVVICVIFRWLRIGPLSGYYKHCSVVFLYEPGSFLASCADLRQNKLHHRKQQSVVEKFRPFIGENSQTNLKRLTQISPPTTCTNFYSYYTQLLHVSAIYSDHLQDVTILIHMWNVYIKFS